MIIPLIPFALALFITISTAFPTYLIRLPNSDASIRPKSGIDCLYLGHEGCRAGAPRNQFGLDFAKYGRQWTKQLCETDSDGDGYTNGQELGDPCCKWTQTNGFKLRMTDLSHPGDATKTNSAPKKCETGPAKPSPSKKAMPSKTPKPKASKTPKPMKTMPAKSKAPVPTTPSGPMMKKCESTFNTPFRQLRCKVLSAPNKMYVNVPLGKGNYNAEIMVKLSGTKFEYTLRPKNNKFFNITGYAVGFNIGNNNIMPGTLKMLGSPKSSIEQTHGASVNMFMVPKWMPTCCWRMVYTKMRLKIKTMSGVLDLMGSAMIGNLPCYKKQCPGGAPALPMTMSRPCQTCPMMN